MASRRRQMLKVLLLGNANVHKTSLLNEFVNHEFTAQYKATIGSDFTAKQLDIDGKFVTVQIWDTAGQESFQSLGTTFYRGTDCCVLVYDVTDLSSFESIPRWRNRFLTQLGLSDADDFPFLLFGINCDKPNKAVETSIAREYAEKNGGMLFYEVFAGDDQNIHRGFEAIIRKALEK